MPTEFESKVWLFLKKIPKGKITTYKQIALALRRPNGARAVGNACNRNPYAPKVPCHRVVRSDGKVGGYSKGVKRKIELLGNEGIEIKNNKIVGFEKYLFKF